MSRQCVVGYPFCHFVVVLNVSYEPVFNPTSTCKQCVQLAGITDCGIGAVLKFLVKFEHNCHYDPTTVGTIATIYNQLLGRPAPFHTQIAGTEILGEGMETYLPNQNPYELLIHSIQNLITNCSCAGKWFHNVCQIFTGCLQLIFKELSNPWHPSTYLLGIS